MNTLTWLLLAALVLLQLLDVLADYLNLRHSNPTLPREFEDIYDQEKYARMQRYEAAHARLDIVKSTFTLGVLILFWLLGGFQWLDVLVRGWTEFEIPRGLLYIGGLYFASFLLSLPFGLYSTYVIEHRFGFNRTKPLTFVVDRLKGLALAAVLGSGFVALLIWLLELGGPGAWFQVWLVLCAVLGLFLYVAPAIFLPLFNKFTPLESGELRDQLLAYAERQHFPIKGLYVMDGSRRSTRSNAFFTGFGRMRKIVLFDTLIKNHPPAELLAVLAHEIGHYKLRHIQVHMITAALNLGLFLFLASRVIYSPTVFTAFGVQEPSVYVGLALFSILFSPLSQLIAVVLGYVSRRHEFEADAFAARTTGRPEALASALKTLSRSNLTNLTPHPLQVILHHSHPPVPARLAALRELETPEVPTIASGEAVA